MSALLRLALDVGDDTPLVFIDPDTAWWLQKIDPNLMLVPDRDHYDYVYKATDLAELTGKNYIKIRSHIKKFWNNYSHTVENITARDREKIMSFLAKWREWKGCENDSYLAHEIEAAAYAIEHLNELSLKGLLIRVNSQVGAMQTLQLFILRKDCLIMKESTKVSAKILQWFLLEKWNISTVRAILVSLVFEKQRYGIIHTTWSKFIR
jgi:hypothetical protein